MKLERKVLDKNNCGSITLLAQEKEDMYTIYNLLAVGDTLTASTIRKVVAESSTGSTEKTSQRTTLCITVESLFFDVQALMLRVNGRNCKENSFVKLGAYHTLDLELHKSFTIYKNEWDCIHFETLENCCDVKKRGFVI